MNKLRLVILIIALGAILVGYLYYKNSALKPKKISLKSGDIFFTPRQIKIKKDQLLEIEIENDGYHTFVIDELGVKTTLDQDNNTRLQIKPTKKGKFIYYCDVEDHRKLGQWGTLIVE